MARYIILVVGSVLLGVFIGRTSMQSKDISSEPVLLHSAHVLLRDHEDGSPVVTEIKIPNGLMHFAVRHPNGHRSHTGRPLSMRIDPNTAAWKLSWTGTSPTEFGQFFFHAEGYEDTPLPDHLIDTVGSELAIGIPEPVILKIRRLK